MFFGGFGNLWVWKNTAIGMQCDASWDTKEPAPGISSHGTGYNNIMKTAGRIFFALTKSAIWHHTTYWKRAIGNIYFDSLLHVFGAQKSPQKHLAPKVQKEHPKKRHCYPIHQYKQPAFNTPFWIFWTKTTTNIFGKRVLFFRRKLH